jgi:hypothetical protein
VAKHYLFYEISRKTFSGGKTFCFILFSKPEMELLTICRRLNIRGLYRFIIKRFSGGKTLFCLRNKRKTFPGGKTFCFILFQTGNGIINNTPVAKHSWFIPLHSKMVSGGKTLRGNISGF